MSRPLVSLSAIQRSLPWLLLPTLALGSACGSDEPTTNAGDGSSGGGGETPDGPPTGSTSFVSADGQNGEQSQNRGDNDFDAGAPEADEGAGGDERTVEEGDIYRVLGNGLILNLNSYRGLQVIDITDPTSPSIVGRLGVTGSPVEMYVVGETAYVLLNNWEGYYGSRADVRVERQTGGLVLAVDLSDPTAPVEAGRSFVPGYIQTSRVAREGDRAALYAVANWWGPWETADGTISYDSRTVVKSFDLTGGGLADRTSLDLGGYVTAVQGTPDALLVARYDWQNNTNRSLVSVVDISSVEGTMVEGDSVRVSGYVQNKFNMDIYNDVLRVVSTGAWNGNNTNFVETFDATDISSMEQLDQETFGDGMQLFATLFLGNKAFFVTYFRVDPFHAFEITDEGIATERAEYVISGWNDFFRPVFDETRLVGIGVDDADGSRNLAVSLYDITDLDNPEPFIMRAEVEADSSWSEASWDDRAFSVVEDAVSILAPDGTEETGLILLPFSGWDETAQTYQSSVQIYTFSADTLTRRGLMNHGTQVRRSFLADDELTANLSEVELSLFDTTNPAAPTEQGRVELAPNYAEVMFFGDYAVRLKDTANYYEWWGGRTERPGSILEVIPAAGNLDMATPVATVEIPAGATIWQAGDRVVAVSQQYEYVEGRDENYRTTVMVVDLSDPTNPVVGGTIETLELQPYYSYYGGGWGRPGIGEDVDCGFGGCGGGWYGYSNPGIYPTENALTFLQSQQQQESIGMVEYCNRNVEYTSDCVEGDDSGESCSYTYGGVYCTTPESTGIETCNGGFERCEQTTAGDWTCEAYEPEESEIREYCNSYEQFRYWQTFSLRTVDLTSTETPVLGPEFALGDREEGVSAIAADNQVIVSYRVPATVEGDSRPYVRYFMRALDLTNPATPVLGTPINVPGEVLAANGETIYTRDTVWGSAIVETAVARLRVFNNLAYLQQSYRFDDQIVQTITLDGAGHLLASHRVAWNVPTSGDGSDLQKLTILDAGNMTLLSEVTVDAWASLTRAEAGRALFNVSGGMLVMNLSNPALPFAQAWFPTRGWSRTFTVRDNRLVFAAGPFGIYEFDLDVFNLLPPL